MAISEAARNLRLFALSARHADFENRRWWDHYGQGLEIEVNTNVSISHEAAEALADLIDAATQDRNVISALEAVEKALYVEARQ